MPQLFLYVLDQIAEHVHRVAKNSGMSVSKYLASVIEKEVANQWPEIFFAQVVGGWQGPPLEREHQGTFEKREDF